MTLWDYLDKHEIVGTILVFLVLLATESVLVAWAKAWAVRKSKPPEASRAREPAL